jgi:hypothetical protein
LCVLGVGIDAGGMFFCALVVDAMRIVMVAICVILLPFMLLQVYSMACAVVGCVRILADGVVCGHFVGRPVWRLPSCILGCYAIACSIARFAGVAWPNETSQTCKHTIRLRTPKRA